ncbi:hypothetical protein WA171_006346 [Blastocystis sp. BT1]
MKEFLQHALDVYRKERNFNAAKWINDKCTLFNDYMKRCGLKAAVVSVSGGIDSAVTLGLMKRSMDLPSSPLKRILGISQPIHSSQWAYDRAAECAKAFGVELVVIDQTSVFDSLKKIVDDSVGVEGQAFASGQLRSYMRTPVGYYVAQLLSQGGTPCIVLGTGNHDEDGYLGYFCKAGDGVVDVQLISDLHKSEVFKVGAELGVPESILRSPPSADLWDGQTDEEELGVSYDFVELYTGWYLKQSEEDQKGFVESMDEETLKEWNHYKDICETVHRRNAHKLNGPMNLNVLWIVWNQTEYTITFPNS